MVQCKCYACLEHLLRGNINGMRTCSVIYKQQAISCTLPSLVMQYTSLVQLWCHHSQSLQAWTITGKELRTYEAWWWLNVPHYSMIIITMKSVYMYMYVESVSRSTMYAHESLTLQQWFTLFSFSIIIISTLRFMVALINTTQFCCAVCHHPGSLHVNKSQIIKPKVKTTTMTHTVKWRCTTHPAKCCTHVHMTFFLLLFKTLQWIR